MTFDRQGRSGFALEWPRLMGNVSFFSLSIAAALLMTALALPAAGQTISVTILQPAENFVVRDGATALSIHAEVQSTVPLTEVKATLASREVSLSFDSGWKGLISISGLGHGSYTLVVTARGNDGSVGSAQRTVWIDALPRLTVTAPFNGAVARPSIRVTATCEDDHPSGCAGINVEISNGVLFRGGSSIDQTISLAAYEGRIVLLWIVAQESVDFSSGVRTDVRMFRQIYVESSPFLIEVETSSAPIVDVTADRMLLKTSSTTYTIRDRSTGAETLVAQPVGNKSSAGYLTPRGAMFIDVEENADARSFAIAEWRDGQLLSFGQGNSLRVNGDYAIWTGPNATNGFVPILYRDLQAGTTVEIGSLSTTLNRGMSLGPRGAVAYSPTGAEVLLYVNGVTRQVTSETVSQKSSPVTDGASVIYRKLAPGATQYSIVRNDNGVETVLSTGTSYRLVNGWAAFERIVGNTYQVFVSSPSAGERQASNFGQHSFVETLSANGEVTYILDSRHRYLSTAGRAPIRISSALGSLIEINGVRHLILGRTLFRVRIADRGDANGDGLITAPDIFYMLNHLFAGGPAPIVQSDFNGDGALTVADVFYAINYLFAGGPGPVGGTN